jgi:arsenate reductase
MEQVLSKDELLHLQQKLKLPLLEMVRTNEAVYKTRFGKHQPSDEELLQAILEHPILLQRPIVETETAAIIARPPEKVLDFIS